MHLDAQGGDRGGRLLEPAPAGGGVTEPLVGAGLVRMEPSGREQLAPAFLVLVRRVSRLRLPISLDHQPVRADAACRGREEEEPERGGGPDAQRSEDRGEREHRREPERQRRVTRRHGHARRTRVQASHDRVVLAERLRVGALAVGRIHGDDAVDLAQARLDPDERGLGPVGEPPGALGALRRRRARVDGLLELAERGRIDRGGVRELGTLALELAELLLEACDAQEPLLDLREPASTRCASRLGEAALGGLGVERRLARLERGALDLRAGSFGCSKLLLRVMGLGAGDLQRALARASRRDAVALCGEDLDRPGGRGVPLAAREGGLERRGDRALVVGDRRELPLSHDEAALEDRA